MSDDPQNILDLQQVSVRYTVGDAEVPVLESLSLGVERAAFLSLMGPSGSGKSTLLNVISGLLPPNTGQVVFEGESLYALDDHARTLLRRQKMGIVFQFFNLLPSLDVLDNVALPLLIAGQDPRRHRGRLHELLDLVGLDHRGGGRRSLIAVITDPRVVRAILECLGLKSTRSARAPPVVTSVHGSHDPSTDQPGALEPRFVPDPD